MNNKDIKESEKILEDKIRLVEPTEQEVADARDEMNFLGIDNRNLYPLNIDKKEEQDDDNYYRKSA